MVSGEIGCDEEESIDCNCFHSVSGLSHRGELHRWNPWLTLRTGMNGHLSRRTSSTRIRRKQVRTTREILKKQIEDKCQLSALIASKLTWSVTGDLFSIYFFLWWSPDAQNARHRRNLRWLPVFIGTLAEVSFSETLMYLRGGILFLDVRTTSCGVKLMRRSPLCALRCLLTLANERSVCLSSVP